MELIINRDANVFTPNGIRAAHLSPKTNNKLSPVFNKACLARHLLKNKHYFTILYCHPNNTTILFDTVHSYKKKLPEKYLKTSRAIHFFFFLHWQQVAADSHIHQEDTMPRSWDTQGAFFRGARLLARWAAGTSLAPKQNGFEWTLSSPGWSDMHTKHCAQSISWLRDWGRFLLLDEVVLALTSHLERPKTGKQNNIAD